MAKKKKDDRWLTPNRAFYTGVTLMTLGGAAASPLDEAILTGATGGLGAVLAPVQGVVTGVLGTGMAIAGAGLVAYSVMEADD